MLSINDYWQNANNCSYKKPLNAIMTNKSSMYRFFALFMLFCYSCTYSDCVFADNVLNVPALQDMINHLSSSIPSLMKLVTGSAFVMGMYLMISSVIRMKHFGEMRSMMGREHAVWGPIIQFFVGAFLIYLPSTVHMMMWTLWNVSSPLAYSTASSTNSEFISSCFLIIQLVGTIAFIRGLLFLNEAGSDKGQNSIGKGLTHLIGGILCINIYGDRKSVV